MKTIKYQLISKLSKRVIFQKTLFSRPSFM